MRPILLACIFICCVVAYPQQPENPIIGLFTDPLDECPPKPAHINATSCMESYFVRWLESAGIRVVPFPWNASEATQLHLAKRINGIIFPGGGMGNPVFTEYFNNVHRIFKWAMKWNEEGDRFFLWGTCFGFQMLASSAAGTPNVLEGGFTDMYPRMMALNFTHAQRNSTMFGNATTPKEILNILQYRNSTLNWHHAGITPDVWAANANINRYLRALSTNTEPSGKKSFISSFEGISANIFATQFHPERPQFEFRNDAIGHTPQDISVSQYLANFVASRLKLNNHSFESPLDAEALMVERWPTVDYGWGMVDYWVIDPK